MPSVPLRHLISAIGIVIALVTAVAPPIGYAYTDGDMWVRLAELTVLPGGAEHVIHQRIYAASDRLVFDNGVSVAAPVLNRTVPIMVGGVVVGRFVMETS